MGQQLRTIGTWIAVRFQTTWTGMKEDERGEGLVSFLIIAVAVAAIAVFVLGVFEDETTDKIGELDFGDTPDPQLGG